MTTTEHTPGPWQQSLAVHRRSRPQWHPPGHLHRRDRRRRQRGADCFARTAGSQRPVDRRRPGVICGMPDGDRPLGAWRPRRSRRGHATPPLPGQRTTARRGMSRRTGLPVQADSVLLLYPDHINDSGTETYYGFVQAADPIEAVAQAQRQGRRRPGGQGRPEPDDFAPTLATQGHQYSEPFFNK